MPGQMIDSPTWLVDLLAEHDRIGGVRDARAHCSCGWASEAFIVRIDGHRVHIAEVVWAELTSRAVAGTLVFEFLLPGVDQ